MTPIVFNPFQNNVSFLNNSENVRNPRFPNVFKGYKMEFSGSIKQNIGMEIDSASFEQIQRHIKLINLEILPLTLNM